MGEGRLLLAILVLFAFDFYATAQNVHVVAPNTFRLGSSETVGVLVQKGSEEVKLSLQDFPGRKKTFSEVKVTVSENVPQVVRMRVNPEDIPDLHLSNLLSKHYVLLVTEGKKFRKEVKVIVGLQAGYVFLQTDKPIYTPKQTVHIRVIPLNEDLLPDNQTFTLQIRNPQNIIVESFPSSSLKQKHGLYSHNFQFPTVPMKGEWSVVSLYGHKVLRNETVKFEMREYSLPTYEVKLNVPEVILPSDEVIEVIIEANYIYGQKVDGSVQCKFGVKLETGKIIHVGRTDIKLLQGGHATCRVTPNAFEEHHGVGWFPKISGNHFVVEVTVTERATGEQETAHHSAALFSNNKYLVDFKRCLRDYKPGFPVTVVADVMDVSGGTASGVKTLMTVKNQRGEIIRNGVKGEAVSDLEGKVTFLLQTATDKDMGSLHITVRTADPEIEEALQGSNSHQMHRNHIEHFVVLERTHIANRQQVGENFVINVYANPSNLDISYVATSGGRVVTLGSLVSGDVRQRLLRLQVTDEMSPSLRITIFAVHAGQTLTDSVKVDVDKVCRAQAQVDLETSFKNAEPGSEGSVIVKGSPDTVVGLVAVDKAVYALRNKGLLTKETMFSKMAEHDLGCGPGGGMDSQSVLANAGLVLVSDTATSAPERTSCSERRIHKRSIREDIMSQYQETERRCCKLGTYPDRLNRPCQERAEIIRTFHDLEESGECSEAFLHCCNETEHLHKPLHLRVGKNFKVLQSPTEMRARLGQNQVDNLDFVDENFDLEFESAVQERKDFRETWLFDTAVIGGDNRMELKVNVPHSITTWMVQAVGINPRQGMCVASPAEVVVFKKVFLQLKLPYSVVRNEQIELRATVFNYGIDRLPVVVYMYGVEGLCSEAQPNEKSERKKVWVSGNGGAETVAFPVVPLLTGTFPIKVVAISPQGSDRLVQMLNVVAEGVPHQEDIVVIIDPSNMDKRKRRNINSDKLETRIDEERKQQLSIVKLTPKQDFVPGTESCVITAIGDKFGTTVHTALNDPDRLIRLPKGCGEQTMAYLAPTLYTLHYLKVTGKVTPQQETNGYKFIRDGYKQELNFRKVDGSYAAFPNRPTSTWLTAFVAKIFCQANKYVFIDENTICSALSWLADHQNPDGSFIERMPIVHNEMTGGIKGTIPMTAFVLNAFYKCDCNTVNLEGAKANAVAFLIEALPNIQDPYQLSIVAYALSLADPSEAGYNANQKLLAASNVDEELNLRHWGVAGTPLSVEASSFALLTQLLHNNKDVASSIVNWLNTQRTTTGSFWSTQDTVIALEALAEYAILARDPEMSLTCNITSSSDVNFRETLNFQSDNARVLRSYELKKVGGRLHFEASGSGVSTLGVNLRYNVPRKVDEPCKFEISVNSTDAKEVLKASRKGVVSGADLNRLFEDFPDDLVEELGVDPVARNDSLIPPPPPPRMEDLPVLRGSGRGPAHQGPDRGPAHQGPVRGPAHRGPDRGPAHRGPGGPPRGPVSPKSRVLEMMEIPHDLIDLVKPANKWQRSKRGIAVNPRAGADNEAKNSRYFANITICVKYLSHRDSNMAVVDVGIFTGYRVDTKDLEKLVSDESLPIARYEEAGRSIVFYLDKIPHEHPVCFWFRAKREFIVSHMESSLVKVYDYYQPDHTCSEFYSPNQHSAIIRKICTTDDLCHCAEGGCPLKNPFDEIMKEDDAINQRKMLREMSCDKHDFVWKVEVRNVEKDQAAFQNVDVKVVKVLKEGRESKMDVMEDPLRQFMGRRNCESGQLTVGQTYIIMGKDKDPIEQPNGALQYNYHIDKQTSIYEWFNIRDRKVTKAKSVTEKNFHKVFMWLETQFTKDEGCLD